MELKDKMSDSLSEKIPKAEELPPAYILCAKIITEPRDLVEGFVEDEYMVKLLTDEEYRGKTIHKCLLNVLPLEDNCDYDTLSFLLTMLTYTSNLRNNKDYKPTNRFNKIVSNFVATALQEGFKKAHNVETKVRKLADVCYTRTVKLYKKHPVLFVNTFRRLNAICFGRFIFVMVLCEFVVIMLEDKVNMPNKSLLVKTLLNMSCIIDKVPINVTNIDTEITRISPFSSTAEASVSGISSSIGNMLKEILKIDPLIEMFQFFLQGDLSPGEVIRILDGTNNMYQLFEYLRVYLFKTPVTLEMIKDVYSIKLFGKRREITEFLFRNLDSKTMNTKQKELCILLCRIEDARLLKFIYSTDMIQDQFSFTLTLIEILSKPKKSGIRDIEFVQFVVCMFNDLFLKLAASPNDFCVDVKSLIKGKISVIIDVIIESRLSYILLVVEMLKMHPIDSYKEKTIVKLASNSNLEIFNCIICQMDVKLIELTTNTVIENENVAHRTRKLECIVEKLIEKSLSISDKVLEALLQSTLSKIIFKYSVLAQSIGIQYLEKHISNFNVIVQALDCVHFDCCKYIPTMFLTMTLLYRDDDVRKHMLPSNHYKKCISEGYMTQEASDKYIQILDAKMF